MLGIILLLAPIFFIWKHYSELAFEHNRSRAGYAALGIGVYVVGYFVFGILSAIVVLLAGGMESTATNLLVGILSIVLGSLSAWSVYLILKSVWGKNKTAENNDQLIDNSL